MSPHQLVESFYAAALPGDWEAVAPLLHDRFSVTESAALPFSGTFQGLAGLRSLGKAIFKHCSRFEVTPQTFTTETDRVIVHLTVEGQIRATERIFTTEILELFVIESGLIREIRPFYWDPSALC